MVKPAFIHFLSLSVVCATYFPYRDTNALNAPSWHDYSEVSILENLKLHKLTFF